MTDSLIPSLRTFLCIALSPVFLAACQQTESPDAATAQTKQSTPYTPVATVHETMAWILDPAADIIWDSAGTIITAQGQQDLTPTTDEEWATVLHAAATLTEAGNLLMMPGRSAGDDWIEYSAGLIDAGKLAIKAAQDQDGDALFDAGGRIYQVCRACHNQYWVKEEETP